MDGLDAKIDYIETRFSGELTLLKWMMGTLITILCLFSSRLFSHKLPNVKEQLIGAFVANAIDSAKATYSLTYKDYHPCHG
jgi:hypothetical protein